MVAVEEIEEGGLGAGDALDPARLQPPALEAQPLEIEDEILEPQTGAFAHRGRLRRLEVGHPETGLRRPALGEVGERGDHPENPRLDQRHGVAGDALFGVVADEAARGAEVEDGFRRRGVLGEDVEVGHDVVPGLALDLGHPDRSASVTSMWARICSMASSGISSPSSYSASASASHIRRQVV